MQSSEITKQPTLDQQLYKVFQDVGDALECVGEIDWMTKARKPCRRETDLALSRLRSALTILESIM